MLLSVVLPPRRVVGVFRQCFSSSPTLSFGRSDGESVRWVRGAGVRLCSQGLVCLPWMRPPFVRLGNRPFLSGLFTELSSPLQTLGRN